MDLKNAVAVCLISLFSATLVVIVARSLDSQAAAKIEPQLTAIVDELRAIRQQGGFGGSGESAATAVRDGLVVYYFHGNKRCPNCEAIESQSRDLVQTDFASQIRGGKLAWKILNYEQPAGYELAGKFEVMTPVVVVAWLSSGQVKEWKRLDEVWALVEDKPAFSTYLRGAILQMLANHGVAGAVQPTASPSMPATELPLPK